MKIRFSKAPTSTKAIIASAVFTIVYLASASSLPPCSDTVAVLNSGACVVRQSFLHTASGWLALICLVVAALLLALKHKDSISGRQAPTPVPTPVPAPDRASNFCATCGSRIITGDRFCQGCGAHMESQ
jgi:hypothetical protein